MRVLGTFFSIMISLALLAAGLYELVYTGTEASLVAQIPWISSYGYWNPAGAAIVVGGVFTSIFTMYPPRFVFGGIGTVLRYFSQSKISAKTLNEDIEMVVNWSDRINNDRLKALQQIQQEHHGRLPGYLFSLVSTNYSTDDIETFGSNNIEEHHDREMVKSEVLRTMANASPAFGMFGTLCGLLMVLEEIQNPGEMASGLATALTTTLYGIVLAHLIFYPCARKLRNIAQIKRFREYMLLDGILMINDEKSDFFIRDKLTSYLARNYSFDGVGEEEAETSPESEASQVA